MANKKQFKLTIHPDIDLNADDKIVRYFSSEDELDNYADGAADILLFVQDVMKLMPDRTNIFIEQELINGTYEDIL